MKTFKWGLFRLLVVESRFRVARGKKSRKQPIEMGLQLPRKKKIGPGRRGNTRASFKPKAKKRQNINLLQKDGRGSEDLIVRA